MDASESLSGITKYLRRKKTKAQLQDIADALYAVVDSEVIFTGANFEGASGNAMVRSYDKGQVLNIVEDLIAEMVNAGVTAWTETESAQSFRRILRVGDRSFNRIAL